MKLGIIVPWDSPFMFTAPAFNMLNWERPEGYEIRFIQGVGWCPANKHNTAVDKAQKWGADLIMFNGGDHVCPKDILPRMIKWIDDGWDMVHAMPPLRGVSDFGVPFKEVSFRVVGQLPPDYMTNCPGESIKILTYDDEPQQSHIAGTGNIMMRAEIFDKLVKPYFREVIKEDDLYGRYPMQDSQFIGRCTLEIDARMICDTTIKIVHLDVFGIDETYSERFKDKTSKKWSPSRELREYK